MRSQWFPERSLSDGQLNASIPIGPPARADLLRVVTRMNHIAKQMELEGVPTYMDWNLFAADTYRAALLVTLRRRTAMRSVQWETN